MHLNPPEQTAPAFYDIDHLRKMSVGRSVETSPIRYAVVRSRAPRFHDSTNDIPFLAYNIDTANKQSVNAHCRGRSNGMSEAFE